MVQRLLRWPPFLRSVAFLVHLLNIKVLPTRFGVFVFSWRLVNEVLTRDNDFRVEPVNGEKMRDVAGDFFLGLDRCPVSWHQRDLGRRAMAQATEGLGEWLEPQAREMLLAGIREKPQTSIDIVGAYARPLACRTAIRLFGIRGPSETELMEATRAIFHQTFLNLKDRDPDVRTKGINQGKRLNRWILDEIAERRASGDHGTDFLGYLLARTDTGLNDQQRAVVLAGHLVGAIDTTTTAFAYIAHEVIRDKNLLGKVRRDLPRPGDPPAEAKEKRRHMVGWCCEALRRRPQAPFLIRKTTAPVELAGKSIPADSTVLAITSSAHFDPNAYPAPGRMDPTRPLDQYFHFGGGAHVCAGANVNAVQLSTLLKVMLAPEPEESGATKAQKKREHRPKSVGRLDFDGPFPDQLIVTFVE